MSDALIVLTGSSRAAHSQDESYLRASVTGRAPREQIVPASDRQILAVNPRQEVIQIGQAARAGDCADLQGNPFVRHADLTRASLVELPAHDRAPFLTTGDPGVRTPVERQEDA